MKTVCWSICLTTYIVKKKKRSVKYLFTLSPRDCFFIKTYYLVLIIQDCAPTFNLNELKKGRGYKLFIRLVNLRQYNDHWLIIIIITPNYLKQHMLFMFKDNCGKQPTSWNPFKTTLYHRVYILHILMCNKQWNSLPYLLGILYSTICLLNMITSRYIKFAKFAIHFLITY